jgi:integral membrane protein
MNKNLLIQYFLRSGKIEGYSYLLLLLVAMPLKYIWDIPEWVQIIGMVHGVLFVIFMVMIFLMIQKKVFYLTKGIIAFLLSLIPFGTFFLHKLIK